MSSFLLEEDTKEVMKLDLNAEKSENKCRLPDSWRKCSLMRNEDFLWN
jgi:hypothetical protein